MQVITVTLERLFDMQRNTVADNSTHVYFSCVADGQRHFSVRLPGNPRLQVGDRITLVLGQPGNWQAIRGWKNHSNGEVIAPGTHSAIAFPVAATFTLLCGLTWLNGGERALAGAATFVLLLITLTLFDEARDAWRARRLLQRG